MSIDTAVSTTVAPQPQVQSKRWQIRLWDILVAIIPLIAMSPMLATQMHSLWLRPHMRFFPLALFAVGLFSVLRMRDGETTHPTRKWAAVVGLAMGVIIFGAGVWRFSPWLVYFSAIVTYFSWALGRMAGTAWPTVAAWTGLLLTTLVLPFNADAILLGWLYETATEYCSRSLDAFSVPHLVDKGLLEMRGRDFDIQSSANSLGSPFALAALAIPWLIFRNRSFFHSLLILLSTLLWIFVANFVQISLLVYAFRNYGQDWSVGGSYAVLCAGTFALAAGCLWLTDCLLSVLLQPVPLAEPELAPIYAGLNTLFCWPREHEDQIPPDDPEEREMFLRMQEANLQATDETRPPLEWRKKKPAQIAVYASSGLMILTGIAPFILLARGDLVATKTQLGHLSRARDDLPGEEALPAQFGQLKRLDFQNQQNSDDSERSLIWRYQWNGQIVSATLSFPHGPWNSTPVGTDNRWSRGTLQLAKPPQGQSDWPWYFGALVNELGGRVYIFQCGLSSAGKPITKPAEAVLEGESGIPPIVNILREGSRKLQATYRFQVQCESGDDLSQSELDQLQQAFTSFRETLLGELPDDLLVSPSPQQTQD